MKYAASIAKHEWPEYVADYKKNRKRLAATIRRAMQTSATTAMLAERKRIIGDLDAVLMRFGPKSPEYAALMMVRNAIEGPMSAAPTKGTM
jgi:hypothetical protein